MTAPFQTTCQGGQRIHPFHTYFEISWGLGARAYRGQGKDTYMKVGCDSGLREVYMVACDYCELAPMLAWHCAWLCNEVARVRH